ncbi:hypothetical protein [Bacillus kwashiorkori]|uniref:hypothetical protein n=1 Tax=Bacillus kwashiorkori TaxID=1522318 RepID=UPI0007809DEF|nr:hypothetical protein [Bacillus kwashiorkori]
MANKYPKDKIDELLDRYVEENKVKIINKRPFAEYVTELYKKGELDWLSKPIPEYYWRKAAYDGFHEIERYNEAVNTPILMENENPVIKLPSIKDSIAKLGNDPEKLFKTLEPYEKEIKLLLKKEKKNEKKIKDLNEKIIEQRKKIKELRDLNKEAQSTIYKLFYYGKDRKEKNLVNLLTTTKNSTKPVKRALENLFNHNAFEFFEIEKVDKNSKVIDIKEHKKESASLDLWKDL